MKRFHLGACAVAALSVLSLAAIAQAQVAYVQSTPAGYASSSPSYAYMLSQSASYPSYSLSTTSYPSYSVYTPPALRRRGFASALVAAVSAVGLASGKEVCVLYTDLANPTSNSIYQKIGYRPVCDWVDYAL